MAKRKLTDVQRQEIRERAEEDGETKQALADAYSVSVTTIHFVLHGRPDARWSFDRDEWKVAA